RSPRQELADSTAHGHVYLRRLRHAQLHLSLLALHAPEGLGLRLAEDELDTAVAPASVMIER
ncbi:MAG TPA: hypothetical protein VIY26_17465, partial [Acidimicrobiales bacterium]